MKRFVLLALILTPFALHVSRHLGAHHDSERVFRPRHGRMAGIASRGHRVRADIEAPKWRPIRGLPMATPERAMLEARQKLDARIRDWLMPLGVSPDWSPSRALLDSMVEAEPVETVERDYGEEGKVYIQTLRLDESDRQRDRLLNAFERQVAGRRVLALGGGLGFVLACLALIAGYIRTDEATKGYYTTPLRLIATAGVGAAGLALYRFLA